MDNQVTLDRDVFIDLVRTAFSHMFMSESATDDMVRSIRESNPEADFPSWFRTSSEKKQQEAESARQLFDEWTANIGKTYYSQSVEDPQCYGKYCLRKVTFLENSNRVILSLDLISTPKRGILPSLLRYADRGGLYTSLPSGAVVYRGTDT